MPRLRAYMGDALLPSLPRRKAAWAGPRVKAGRRASQAERSALAAIMGAPAEPGIMDKIGAFLQKYGPAAGQAVKTLLKGRGGALATKDYSGFAAGILPGFEGGASSNGNGKRRRSINPTNVKALRRAFRRAEGFRSLVKRVDKMLPPAARMSASRSRAHGRGCKCAACK